MDMKIIIVTTVLLSHVYFSSGFQIRLWPINARGNEGFVEAFYNGTWGFVGNPEVPFTDATATFLCKKLGLSEFGYSSGWTSIGNYGGYSWLHELDCLGNETDIEQCSRKYEWNRYNYSNKTSWAYRHGTRLYCVDSRLEGGQTQNTGMIQTAFDGNIYTVCYDGFDMNAANVVCNSLGYDGALNFVKGEPGMTPIYDRKISCKGCEYSWAECDRSTDLITNKCSYAAVVTCKAVRLARMSHYTDEGPVEIFYNGSWGFIGDPGFSFNDKTASYLCSRFGLGDVGFGTTAHSLQTYGRKAWLGHLSCEGNETDLMQCDHSPFSFVPILMHTYRRGTWLYCFGFNITNIRLVDGSTSNEGRVELLINGRWGSICIYNMRNYYIENAAKVICMELGYSELEKVFYDGNRGHTGDQFWMSEVACSGNEENISRCIYTKGPMTPCYDSPVYLKVRCTDKSHVMPGPDIIG